MFNVGMLVIITGFIGKLVIFILLMVGIIGSAMILKGIWNMISGIIGMVAIEKQRQRPARSPGTTATTTTDPPSNSPASATSDQSSPPASPPVPPT